MTFLFLDRVAGIVGPPDALVAEARERIFRKPLRHEGLKRQPRDEVRAHVAGVVVRVANDKLREPLMAAVRAHAEEAGETHVMMTGDEPGSEGYQAAVVAAFDGNDVGIDMTAFALGEAKPEAVADQVLVAPDTQDIRPENPMNGGMHGPILAKLGVTTGMLNAIVDEVLAPAESIVWSLEALAAAINQSMQDQTSGVGEGLRYLLCDTNEELRFTGKQILGLDGVGPDLNAWLDERAMFSSPEADEADVAEVLRLIAMHNDPDNPEITAEEFAKMRPAREVLPQLLKEADKPAPAAAVECICPGKGEGIGAHLTSCPMSPKYGKTSAPVAVEPSDVTRATAGALKALFELTKESDTNVAKTIGVDKAVVAQSRKGTTPWHPEPAQLSRLYALVGRYNDGLAAAAGALGALPQDCFASEDK